MFTSLVILCLVQVMSAQEEYQYGFPSANGYVHSDYSNGYGDNSYSNGYGNEIDYSNNYGFPAKEDHRQQHVQHGSRQKGTSRIGTMTLNFVKTFYFIY